MFKKAIIKRGVTPNEYHSLGSRIERGNPEFIMSNSELKAFGRSPSKWIGGYCKVERSESLDFGDLLDCLVTTPERFATDFAITPETYPAKGKKDEPPISKPWTRQADYCKQWESDQERAGKTVIRHTVASEAHAAKARLKKDPFIWPFIESCEKQICVIAEWHDEGTNMLVPIKCLIDLVPKDNSLADFKTTQSAVPRDWRKTVFSLGYIQQAALYLDAYNCAANEKRDTFRHIVQESSEPYECFARELSHELLTIGRATYMRRIADYCRCVKDNFWPNYDQMDGLTVDGWTIVEPEPWMVLAE